MFIHHPETGKADTMLTAAIAGFVFVTLFTTAAFVASWVLNNPDFLTYVAAIDGAILTPSLAAYTIRKHTDAKKEGGGFDPRSLLKKGK